MEQAVIFDIDGTIADCNHRLHLVTDGNRKWDEFFKKAHLDTVIPGCDSLIDCMFGRLTTTKFLFVTAMSDEYYSERMEWIRKNLVMYEDEFELHMRKKGDYRKDTIVKEEILHELQKRFQILFAVDDRLAVVEMYRKNGIWTLHCASDDITPDYQPGNLYLMVGPSGAGKSTYVKNCFPLETVVSSDNLRSQLCGSFQDQSKNKQVFDAMHALIKTRIEHGLDCVVDATNIRDRDRKAILALVPKNTMVTYIVVNRPLEEKEQTAGWREGVMVKDGVSLIQAHDETFRQNYKAIMNGDGDPRVSVTVVS